VSEGTGETEGRDVFAFKLEEDVCLTDCWRCCWGNGGGGVEGGLNLRCS